MTYGYSNHQKRTNQLREKILRSAIRANELHELWYFYSIRSLLQEIVIEKDKILCPKTLIDSIYDGCIRVYNNIGAINYYLHRNGIDYELSQMSDYITFLKKMRKFKNSNFHDEDTYFEVPLWNRKRFPIRNSSQNIIYPEEIFSVSGIISEEIKAMMADIITNPIYDLSSGSTYERILDEYTKIMNRIYKADEELEAIRWYFLNPDVIRKNNEAIDEFFKKKMEEKRNDVL